MTNEMTQDALVMLAWSRIWSPLVSDEMREEAWRALELPGDFCAVTSEYWSLFHVGSPSPRISTLLHVALGREGASVREDWMRAADHLGLRWNDARLAPDQLGVACEVYACAIQREEPVLIHELRRRYLLPWCEAAGEAVGESTGPISILPTRLAADLQRVISPDRAELELQARA
jgi:TorA maturation chaperone TorD